MIMYVMLFFMIWPCGHAELNPQDGFQSGIRLLQEKKYSEAGAAFQNEFDAGRDFAALFYNWGLAEYYSQKKGLAVGLWRKALSIDANLEAAHQALDYVKNQLPALSSQNEESSWQIWQTFIGQNLSLNNIIFVTWLLFIFSGYLIIRYFSARKTALVSKSSLPQWPTLAFVFSILFIFSIIITGIKVATLYETRATVISSTVALRTSPSDDGNVIFDLLEGVDVQVKKVNPPWALVRLRSGVSGWLPTVSLFQHSGKTLLW